MGRKLRAVKQTPANELLIHTTHNLNIMTTKQDTALGCSMVWSGLRYTKRFGFPVGHIPGFQVRSPVRVSMESNQ